MGNAAMAERARGAGNDLVPAPVPMPSLRANGSRERAPDDRLREAIHLLQPSLRAKRSNPSLNPKEEWIASAIAPLRKRFAFVAGNGVEALGDTLSRLDLFE